MVKLDGRGERVNNSLGASQFSRHLSLNRESRQPVCASSRPLKHSTYTSVSHYITIVSFVKVRHFEKWSRARGMFGEHEDEENSETLAS